MLNLDTRRLAGAKAKGARPYFMDPQTERVMAVAMAITMEHAVTRERLDTIERLLEAGHPVTRAAIDAYRPDAAAMVERQSWQADYIARVLRIVQQQIEAVEEEGRDSHPETLAAEFAA